MANINTNRYKLASNTVKKIDCPYCGAKKHWQRYIDTQTGEILPDEHGKCDNAIKCGKHITPKQTGYAKEKWKEENGIESDWQKLFNKPLPKVNTLQIEEKEPAYIPVEVFQETLTAYEQNTFIQNLLNNVAFPFSDADVSEVIQLYGIGTVPDTKACSFAFIDAKGNIRGIQEKIFDKENHTDKSKEYHTTWLHSRLKYTKYKNKDLPQWLMHYLDQSKPASCLFGEHLLNQFPKYDVAIVEAPKTAIYCWLYLNQLFPNIIWLSSFNIHGLNYNKCKVLQGRTVYLFPDINAFELWTEKANYIESKLPSTKFIVSDLLEQLAPEHAKTLSLDIADFLIELDWRLFRTNPPQQTSNKADIEPKEEKPSKDEEERINALRTRIQELKQQIAASETECSTLENTFIQIAEKCKVSWYAPPFIKEPPEHRKISELKYWTS